MSDAMRAMVLSQIVSLDDVDQPLQSVDLPTPEPKSDEVLINVAVCGVCHTELDEIEGRTVPLKLPIVLGHEVVGRIIRAGSAVSDRVVGDRVGVGWIFSSRGGVDENLSDKFLATGRDVDGGYAEFMAVPASYTYPIPDAFRDEEAAPLMCAGAIGYRALKLCQLSDGDRLGLTGFGGSAHLVLQLARHLYPSSEVSVFARGKDTQHFARELGATWAGDITDRSPQLQHAIIDTTPAWKPVVEALRSLQPGGRLVVNAIRKEDADKAYLQNLNYHEHLWMEKEIKTVANITRNDIAQFLPLAAQIPIKPTVTTYPLEQANRALIDLRRGNVQGKKVLVVD